MSHKAEKWGGRVLLGCSIGFMVLISGVATSVIADPSKVHDPVLIGGFIAGFAILGAPVGLLVTVLRILRRINRYKDKREEAHQFSWMSRK